MEVPLLESGLVDLPVEEIWRLFVGAAAERAIVRLGHVIEVPLADRLAAHAVVHSFLLVARRELLLQQPAYTIQVNILSLKKETHPSRWRWRSHAYAARACLSTPAGHPASLTRAPTGTAPSECQSASWLLPSRLLDRPGDLSSE